MINIVAIPAFQDNYIWLLYRGACAVVVDPGDAQPALDYLHKNRLHLVAILNTHHHADHVGGNAALLDHFDVSVWGPRHEFIPTVTKKLSEHDSLEIPELSLKLHVLDIPGHTSGHIAYYGAESLFCGDTLFGCGCGRLFEGTPAQMLASLEKLAQLPENTRVYCGHEYTLANIRFAKTIEPDNVALLEREKTDHAQIHKGLPTLPSTIGLEKQTNPFLRCGQKTIAQEAQRRIGRTLDSRVEVFAAVRELKNCF
jgi:hydroxyacylglutathione hydrolase